MTVPCMVALGQIRALQASSPSYLPRLYGLCRGLVQGLRQDIGTGNGEENKYENEDPGPPAALSQVDRLRSSLGSLGDLWKHGRNLTLLLRAGLRGDVGDKQLQTTATGILGERVQGAEVLVLGAQNYDSYFEYPDKTKTRDRSRWESALTRKFIGVTGDDLLWHFALGGTLDQLAQGRGEGHVFVNWMEEDQSGGTNIRFFFGNMAFREIIGPQNKFRYIIIDRQTLPYMYVVQNYNKTFGPILTHLRGYASENSYLMEYTEELTRLDRIEFKSLTSIKGGLVEVNTATVQLDPDVGKLFFSGYPDSFFNPTGKHRVYIQLNWLHFGLKSTTASRPTNPEKLFCGLHVITTENDFELCPRGSKENSVWATGELHRLWADRSLPKMD